MDTTEEIYPMPAFPHLSVTDLAASTQWYQEALGFRHIFTMPGLVHLRWAKYADVLLTARPVAPGRRGLGIVLTFNCWNGTATVDEVAARATAAGAQIAAPPAQTPWNTRECTILDPDGYQIRFTEPVNTNRSFDEVIAEATKATTGQ